MRLFTTPIPLPRSSFISHVYVYFLLLQYDVVRNPPTSRALGPTVATTTTTSGKAEVGDGVARSLPPASNKSILCHKSRDVPVSCTSGKWRTIDGSCNNIDNPLWGASSTALRRLLPSRYENNMDAPVGWDRTLQYSGFFLPSPRDVSVGVIGAKSVKLDAAVNPLLMTFGQYLSHDTDLTRHIKQLNPGLTLFPNGNCKDDCSQNAPCFPIPISASDPRRASGQKCVEFIRSVPMCESPPDKKRRKKRSDADDDPIEQMNEVTSFIDASTVYGSNAAKASSLRGANGTLKVDSQKFFLKGLLPFQSTSKGCTPLAGKEIKRVVDIPCFDAGDGRVNEHLGLIVLHTIFVREHNRIVEQLSQLNPDWDGDRLFEEARSINVAIHQHVTFNEYLPRTLGNIGMKMIGSYAGYNPRVDPSVSTEFSTAAFRFGHGQIHPIQHRLDEKYQEIPQGNLPVRLTFFAPYRVVEEGGLDPLLRGLIATQGKEMTNESPLSEGVTEELWVLTEKHALDLGALNTQRGRDHALRSYLDYRRFCLLSAPTTWNSFTSIMRGDIVTKLEELYGTPENIDLWVGALLEERLPGADVGPTFTCMLVEGFRRIRDGDRFWHERATVFTAAQLNEVRKTSLARIICDNSDAIDRVPPNVFLMTHPDKMAECDQIPGINFTAWKEEPAAAASTLIPTTQETPTTT